MKPRFRVTKRGDRDGMCYIKDSLTGERVSLETKDRAEAERILQHKNETLKNPSVNRKIGMVYLSAADPLYATRTWKDVMDDIINGKKGPTLVRYLTAAKDPAYQLIVKKLLVETMPEDLKGVLHAGGTATNVYLRRYQNHAFDMGWLHERILPKRNFPRSRTRKCGASPGTSTAASLSARKIQSGATTTNCATASGAPKRTSPA